MVGRRGATTAAVAVVAVVEIDVTVVAAVVVVATAAAVANICAPCVVKSSIASAKGRANLVASRGIGVPRHDSPLLVWEMINRTSNTQRKLLQQIVATIRCYINGGRSDRQP